MVNMEMDESKKHLLMFLGALVGAGIIISTLVFPFWNLIREDVFEDTVILETVNGVCYADSIDHVPKTISDCDLPKGTNVKIKYGRDLAWATIVEIR